MNNLEKMRRYRLPPANGPVHSRAQGAAMANIKLGLLVSSSDDGPAIEISDFYIDTVVNTQYAVKVPRVNKIGVTNFTSNRIYL